MLLQEKMPEKLKRLPLLADNLWWSWNPDARDLFRRLDLTLWRDTQHNPVQLLYQVEPERLATVAQDPAFMRRYEMVMLRLDEALQNGHSWFHRAYPELTGQTVAYFSAEFGLHNTLPVYAGGLGILSGDHAKEASDLGLPLVGLGFMYPQGYFQQRIPLHGWQETVYVQLDMNQAPIHLVQQPGGDPLKVDVRIGDRNVFARVWHVQVGRTPLYLMDTDVEENDPWDRELSARLYGGDSELRIRQEMMLGIGGVRVLRKLGIEPKVWHMNEGHSAFLLLECLREKVSAGIPLDQALDEVRGHSLFTTHTPVAAGHDAFPFHMVEHYFSGYWDELGLTREAFLRLGEHQETWGTAFNMTVLALRLSGKANAVSRLHGEVSRKMWQEVWPDRPHSQVPISHVTNGVHLPTWVAGEIHQVFREHLGPDWVERQDDQAIWERLAEVPDQELWDAHVQLKRKLIHFLRERVRQRWIDGSNDAVQVLVSGRLLDPEALTIGFARRFATYKRATLIFKDVERLRRLVLNPHRPVQFIFAGKAHPADDGGKRLIQEIYNMAKNNQFGGRIAFVEDYDMHIARYLQQGVDVWLNTPRRPREASGTSGMKAALNGIPHLSILDGWWAEGYNGANGWAIGSGQSYPTDEEQDWADATSLYQILEEEIVPLFYGRDRDGIPRGWVEVVREAIRSDAPRFSLRRMLKEYTERFYVPAMRDMLLAEPVKSGEPV